MCDANIAGIMSMTGTVMGAIGSYQQAQAQAAAYRAQAAALEQNARLIDAQRSQAQDVKADEMQRLRANASKTAATQKAAMAANGLDTGSGSNLDILNDTTYLSEIDAAMLRYKYDINDWQMRVQKTDTLNQASMARSVASNASKAGTIGAMTSLFSGVGQVAGNWYKWQDVAGSKTSIVPSYAPLSLLPKDPTARDKIIGGVIR